MTPIIAKLLTAAVLGLVLLGFKMIPPRHKIAHYCLLALSAVMFVFLASAAA